MAFTTEMSKLVGDQFAKFVTLNRHQLAGQVANLEFWLAEVRHCLEVIDGYGSRFTRLKAAQTEYVEKHDTVEFRVGDREFEDKASPPRRIPDRELREARRSLCEATSRFLIRCCNEGFIDEPTLRRACGELDLGVEATDLKPRD